MRLPGAWPRPFRCDAIRRLSSITWRQVYSRTAPPPVGWVRITLSGVVRSQWYRRCSARSSARAESTVAFMAGVLRKSPADGRRDATVWHRRAGAKSGNTVRRIGSRSAESP